MTKPSLLKLAPLALAAALAQPARADIVNGDFSQGLAGWSTLGDASVSAAGGGEPARLWLTTASTDFADDFDAGLGAGARNASGIAAVDNGTGAIEAYAGAPAQSLAAVYEGSAATQAFSAAAGSRLSFRWDLGTLDARRDPALADVAFVVIDGRVTTLGDIGAATQPGTDGNATHTGWASFSTTFASTGTHTIAFGIGDVGDYDATSTLAIAGVSVSAVPEAPALALFAAGLGLLGLARRRRLDR
jgi:MYXO-CTERM domain-containing protein